MSTNLLALFVNSKFRPVAGFENVNSETTHCIYPSCNRTNGKTANLVAAVENTLGADNQTEQSAITTESSLQPGTDNVTEVVIAPTESLTGSASDNDTEESSTTAQSSPGSGTDNVNEESGADAAIISALIGVSLVFFH